MSPIRDLKKSNEPLLPTVSVALVRTACRDLIEKGGRFNSAGPTSSGAADRVIRVRPRRLRVESTQNTLPACCCTARFDLGGNRLQSVGCRGEETPPLFFLHVAGVATQSPGQLIQLRRKLVVDNRRADDPRGRLAVLFEPLLHRVEKLVGPITAALDLLSGFGQLVVNRTSRGWCGRCRAC